MSRIAKSLKLVASLLGAGVVTVAGCAPSPRATSAEVAPRPTVLAAFAKASLELVESAPVETTLGHAEIRDASVVWLEMIGGARRTIDLAEFYTSDAEGPAKRTSLLSPVIRAVCDATKHCAVQ